VAGLEIVKERLAMGILKTLGIIAYICVLPVYLVCYPVIWVLKNGSKPHRKRKVIRNRRT